MAYTYILHSNNIDKFYIGVCHKDLNNRIKNHNLGSYGDNKFTAQTKDWILFLKFELENYAHAIRLERKIKSMKSSKYILNLLKYPELRKKIVLETKNT